MKRRIRQLVTELREFEEPPWGTETEYGKGRRITAWLLARELERLLETPGERLARRVDEGLRRLLRTRR